MGPLLVGYRVFFAFLGFSALVTEIATLSERSRFTPANFFSFFTVQSNMFAVIVLMLSALAAAGGKRVSALSMLRGASTLYMTVVGVVFPLLLSGLDAEFTAVPWDNIVLHYLMPAAVVADWFVDIPPHRISFKQALIWLAVPIVYVIYSLVRGYLLGWYPYPFLDPGTHGYLGVALASIGIALVATALTGVLTRFMRRHPETQQQG